MLSYKRQSVRVSRAAALATLWFAGSALAQIVPGASAVYETDLEDAGGPSNVEWSATGKINWKHELWTPNGWVVPLRPKPYGDILGYTAGGIGDVNADGYGDFATTWYRAEPRPEDLFDAPGTLDWEMNESVGFVRVLSGAPGNAQIGPDFWGTRSNAIWAHEITTIGDIDGDGKDDMILAANTDRFDIQSDNGLVEIWACTSEYNLDGPGDRWVKLLVIRGEANSSNHEGFGYQSYHGPIPGPDFNNDGTPDLLLSSKWYHNEDHAGHVVDDGNDLANRTTAPGAAWLFMMPPDEIFAGIRDRVLNDPDSVPDDGNGLPAWLPLIIESDEYNVRIHGHQVIPDMEIAPDAAARHFGYAIDSAGDLDDDGNVDLLVTAPLHMTDVDYANAVSAYVPGSDDWSDFEGAEVGRVYFFLSDSERTNRAAPAPRIHETVSIYQVDLGAPGGFSKIDQLTFEANEQIQFSSADADYAMTGATAGHGFAQTVEGGVSLTPALTASDFAVRTVIPAGVDIYLDMTQRVSDIIAAQGKPVSAVTELLGQFLFPAPEVEIRVEDCSAPGGPFASPAGFRIAGNWDGLHGDCELFVNAQINNTGASALLVYNITASGGSNLRWIYRPESDPCAFSGANNFDSVHPSAERVQAWPIWHSTHAPGGIRNEDVRDDPLIAARGFPAALTEFPLIAGRPDAADYDTYTWVSIVPTCLDWMNSYVSVGKVYVHRAGNTLGSTVAQPCP